jgi:cell division protein FtsB
MSQMTVAPRLGRPTATHTLVRPGLGRATGRAAGQSARGGRTRVVDASPAVAHAGFRLLCLLIVLGAFTAVLLLNTARAEGSYIQSRLASEATALHDHKVTLEAQLANLQSAETLAESARKLDMVPSTSTATLRLSDGAITGVASKVDGGRALTVDLPSTGVATDKDR